MEKKMKRYELRNLIIEMVIEVVNDAKDYSLTQEYGDDLSVVRTDETDERKFLTIKKDDVLDFINFYYSKNEILQDFYNLYHIKYSDFENLLSSDSEMTVSDFLYICTTYVNINCENDYFKRVAERYVINIFSDEILDEILKDFKTII